MVDKKFRILTINPGSTSTKIGIFDNEEKIFEKTIRHSAQLLEQFPSIWDQYSFRKSEIIDTLKKNNFDISKFDAIVGRGGLFKAIPNGTYIVDEDMIQDARIGIQGQHASNLGCVLAYSIAWEYNIPAYIVDPPVVDDMEDVAKISGHAEIQRKSIFHALNIFATARNFAKDINKNFNDLNLIVAHLGGGISVAAISNGKAINTNNALQEGPFSPERSGSLPPLDIIEMAFSGKYTKEQMKKMIVGKGGFVSYFGTNKASDVENLAIAGSKKHKLLYEAMAYQVAEAIGARATNLKGKIDAIILTGGIANAKLMTDLIKERVEFLAPVYIYPGELELEALAAGALRVLRGEETPKRYNIVLPKIAFIYWDNIEAYVALINHIEDHLREKGYNIRSDQQNILIEYANCKADEDRAKMLTERLIDSNVDLIFAIGSPAAIRTAQYARNTNIPIIFTGIYSEKIFTNLPKKPNNYYINYAINFEEQFNSTIKQITPKIKKLGVTYQNGDIQSNLEHDNIREFCKKHNIECVSFDIQSHGDFNKAAELFEKHKVDWVYLGSDNITATTTAKELEPITTKFPTLCALQDTCYNGGLISYSLIWTDLSKIAANLGFKILNKLEIKKEDIDINLEKIITLNPKTAQLFEHLDIFNKIQNYKTI